MVKFGKMRRILSLFLGAMSFGAQGAYAGKKKDNVGNFDVSVSSKSKDKGRDTKGVKDAKRKKRSKNKNAKAGGGRRAGRVNVNADKALRIVKDAKSKGHKVNVNKIGRNKAEVTVTDESGDTVTYVVGGVSVAVIAAVIGLSLYSKGTQKGGEEKEKEKEKDKEKETDKDKEKEKEKEKAEKEEAEKKAVLVNEIENLRARCERMRVIVKVDDLDALDINALKAKKTELEGEFVKARGLLARLVKFTLEFSADKRSLDDLSDDDFVGVYEKFLKCPKGGLAISVLDMVRSLEGEIEESHGAIATAWKLKVNDPLELLGFESYDKLREAWGNLNNDNLKKVRHAFGVWFNGKCWMNREEIKKKGIFDGFFGDKDKKIVIKGTTFREYLKEKYAIGK